MKAPRHTHEAEGFLRDLLASAIKAADPQTRLPAHLPKPPMGRTLVVAIGKAAASMAAAIEAHWPVDAPLSGLALTRDGHGAACRRIKVIEAAHPVPDDRGAEAADRIMEEVSALKADDLLLFAVSGGGSSLMVRPVPAITLAQKQEINRLLLMSGVPIGDMNVVRKHLSAIKGGHMARLAAPARIHTMAISDVPGDDPSTIASGPTVPDPSTSRDALAIIQRYGLDVPANVADWLKQPESETPKAGDTAFDRATFTMVCKPADMLTAVESMARKAGIRTISLGADVEGEARDVAAVHAEIIKRETGPVLVLSGGETTVTVASGTKPGRGGRNCEYLLALALALDGEPGTHALAADTDGIDGSETNAGAVITPDTLTRARERGLDASDHLACHDSFTFFEKSGDLVVTGPTGTNVNDFRAIWKF